MAEIARNSIVVPVVHGTIRLADFKEALDPDVPRKVISPIISERGNHLYIHCTGEVARVRLTARFFDVPGEHGVTSMEDSGTARLELRSPFVAVYGSPGSNFLWGAPFQGPAQVRVSHAGRRDAHEHGDGTIGGGTTDAPDEGPVMETYLLDISPAR